MKMSSKWKMFVNILLFPYIEKRSLKWQIIVS